MSTTTCSKIFADLPFAHRQHLHQGHCALIHGHNWVFELEFACDRLDENQFVVDFGELKFIRAFLEENFDHTLLLNQDDPCLPVLREKLLRPDVPAGTLDDNGIPFTAFAKIVAVPNCGAEGLAKWIFQQLNPMLRAWRADWRERGVRVSKVIAREDSKNFATYAG